MRTTDDSKRRDQIIAGVLWYGTWLATALIAAGVLLSIFVPFQNAISLSVGGHNTVEVGIAMFILLPVARVVVMLVIFLSERDYVYVSIAALVLATIAACVSINV